MRDIPIGGQDSVLNLHEAKALKLNSLCDDSTIGIGGGDLILSRIPSRRSCGDLAINFNWGFNILAL